MAKSHTGHLTGSDAVTSAVFRQFGVTRVDGLDELQDTAAHARPGHEASSRRRVHLRHLGRHRRAHGRSRAEAGLRLPELAPATQRALHEWIPTYLRVSNPVDNGGAPSADWRGRKILDALVADPNIDVVICPITGALASMSKPLARDLVDVAETTDKPICAIWGSPVTADEPAYDILLSSSKVITFRTFDNCVEAVRAYFDYHEFASAVSQPVHDASGRAGRSDRRGGLPARTTMSEHESKQLLAAYGITVDERRGRVVGDGCGQGRARRSATRWCSRRARARSPTRAIAASCASGSTRRRRCATRSRTLAPHQRRRGARVGAGARRYRMRRRCQHRRAVRSRS